MKTSIRYAREKDKTHCDDRNKLREREYYKKGYEYYDRKGGKEKVEKKRLLCILWHKNE